MALLAFMMTWSSMEGAFLSSSVVNFSPRWMPNHDVAFNGIRVEGMQRLPISCNT